MATPRRTRRCAPPSSPSFCPISLGATGHRDTSGIGSAGPQISLTLPLFNRNRGGIALARASRAQLGAQYQASLDAAAGGARALAGSIALLQAQVAADAPEAARAAAIATAARQAYAAGAISASSFASLQTAAGAREQALISLRGQVQTAEISLTTLLGLGLPTLGPVPKDAPL